MAYTNAWSSVIPAGGTNANLIDNHIRQVRLDLAERLAGVFVDITTDPVVVRDDVRGVVVGKQMIIGPFGHSNLASLNWSQNDLYTQIDSAGGGTLRYNLVLPPGITITKFEFLSDKQSSASVNINLQKLTFSAVPGAISVIQNLINNVAGIQLIASGVLAALVSVGETWTLEYAAAAWVGTAPRYYGARITYNTPDSRNTL